MEKFFVSRVRRERNTFNELLRRAKVDGIIYPSRHFFERAVERNLQMVDLLYMLVPVLKEFRESTFNDRTFCIRWKEFRLFADIRIGDISGKRQIVMKTIYDKDIYNERDFDVVVTI